MTQLLPGHLKHGQLTRKTYGQGSCPTHGDFVLTNSNQGEDACPNLECTKARAVARVKALRKKRKPLPAESDPNRSVALQREK